MTLSYQPIRAAAIPLAAAMALLITTSALAQDEAQPTTISAVDRGEVTGLVNLEGSALEQTADDEYLFSDGTAVIAIEVSMDASEVEAEVPLFTLIGIEGTVVNDGIDVTAWAPLGIMTPAVIVPEEQVIEAFWGWIIAYGSQAPVE